MKTKTCIVILALLVFLWGLSWPIAKIGLSYTSPTNFIELRFIMATLAMFLIVILTKNFVIPKLRDLPIILVIGFFQMALMMNLSNYGLSIIGAGRASFLIYTTSVWIIPLSLFVNKKMQSREWISFGLGILGVIILLNPFVPNWHYDAWIGDMALLISSISWAIGILCARHMQWHRPPLQLLPWQLLFSTLCTVGFGYFQGVSVIPSQMSFSFLGVLLYTGAISTALGYLAMLQISLKLSPAVISFGLIWVPVVSLIFSYFFLNESITPSLIIAVLCITGGILIHIQAEKRREQQIQSFKQVP